jgi:hypothetical protein
MNARVLAALACLVVGAPVAAWGLAEGRLFIGLLGLALVLVFIYLVAEVVQQAGKPKHEIPKSPNPAWDLKDRPPGDKRDGEAP